MLKKIVEHHDGVAFEFQYDSAAKPRSIVLELRRSNALLCRLSAFNIFRSEEAEIARLRKRALAMLKPA